jgi:ubiquinone/menaquinone biosynthesis C-methylase UbiE
MLGVIPFAVRQSLDQCRVLEIGCGSGFWLRQLMRWGATPANISGIDLLEDRISEARRSCSAGVHLTCGDASSLAFDDNQFDVMLQATAFSSMLNPIMRRAVAGEMLRTLKPGGYILWYDFFVNNPWNPDVRGIGKKEIRQLFPRCAVHLERLTLAPPVGRALAKISPIAYRIGSAAHIFSTHYLGLLQKA